ncbi:MAG: class I SAM-dependent methyltransferase [Solirubrobacterales bacterium]
MGVEAWSLANPGNRAARAELTAALLDAAEEPIRGPGALLDCGCGSGWLLEALAGAGIEPRRLHGVEPDSARREAARGRVPGAEIIAADATALPFADSAFAAVFFVVSLSSMGAAPTVRAALAEGQRVLGPGGLLAIYEPRLPNPLNRDVRLLRRADLRAAGVTPTETHSLTLLPPLGRRLGRLTGALHPVLLRLAPLRSHRLAVHRKQGTPAGSGT